MPIYKKKQQANIQWADIVKEWQDLTAEGMTDKSKQYLDKVFKNAAYKKALTEQCNYLNKLNNVDSTSGEEGYTSKHLKQWLEQEFQHRQMKKSQQQENPTELEQRIKNSLYSLDSWAMGFLGYTYANLIFSSTMFISELINQSIDAVIEENEVNNYDDVLNFKKAAIQEIFNKTYGKNESKLAAKIKAIFTKFGATSLLKDKDVMKNSIIDSAEAKEYAHKKLAEIQGEHLGKDAGDLLMEKEVESFLQLYSNYKMKTDSPLLFSAQSIAKPVMNAALKSGGMFFELTNDYIIGRQQSQQGDLHLKHRLAQQPRMVRRA